MAIPLTPLNDPTVTPGTPAADPAAKGGELGPHDYQPTDEQRKRISTITDKREKFRRFRLGHEQQWFLNGAILRGQQQVQWNVMDQRMGIPPAPPHRVRLAINRTRPKIVARRSKFLKNRTQIEVFPARSDMKAKMDARASKKAINYVWRKDRLDAKKRQALMQAEICGKGFWWVYWDDQIMGRVEIEDPMTGQKTYQEALLGDVCVEVGSAYEVLVGIPGASRLADQPEILRVKLRPIDEVKGRYPAYAPFIAADSNQTDLFRYENQLSTLSGSATGGFANVEVRDRGNTGKSGQPEIKDMVLVTEHFERPTAQFPKGRYAVLAGNVLVREADELPYGFHDLENPYPCIEFVDQPSPNQFWSTTLIEQLIPLQREYNMARSKLAEHIKNATHPKLIVWKQNRMKPGAWTNESGEVIELIAVPGVPQPIVVTPPPISNDLWQSLQLIQSEFDDISMVHPVAEGARGGTTSGFQTNQLQEATDAVHTPDLLGVHAAMEEAAYKIRRVMRQGYTVPRIIQALGKNAQPDIEEFAADQIDEFAEIVIEGSNALPDNKAIRIQMVKEMFEVGFFGQPGDPEASRKALSLMEMGGPEEAIDDSKIDENQASIENNKFVNGLPVPPPEFYQNHEVHYKVHTTMLKSPESAGWQPPQRQAALQHVIGHLDLFNPQAAVTAIQQLQSQGIQIQPPMNAMMLMQQQAAAQAAPEQQQQQAPPQEEQQQPQGQVPPSQGAM